MNRNQVGVWVMLCSVLLLTACTGPKTPEEVTQAFWRAVVAGEDRSVVRHSTLDDAGQYDGFSRDWSGMVIVLGEVVIRGDSARVSTSASGDDGTILAFTTFLDRHNGTWLVDYRLTSDAVRAADGLDRLIGQIGQMGRAVSEQFTEASDSLGASLQGLAQQFGVLAERLDAQMHDRVERYGHIMRDNLDELSRSIRQTLDEMGDRLSRQDREKLEQTLHELQQSSEALAEPSLEAIGEGSETAAEALQELNTLEGDQLDDYRDRWEQWLERINVDLHKALSDLDGSWR